jgi:hypothetical protein
MTVCAILFGLLPIMWSPVYLAGADVMKTDCHANDRRVVTSAILELPIYPVIYVIWRKGELGFMNNVKLQTCQLRNRAPITSSELAWRWQRLSFSDLPRSPLPFSAPLACSWLFGDLSPINIALTCLLPFPWHGKFPFPELTPVCASARCRCHSLRSMICGASCSSPALAHSLRISGIRLEIGPAH